MEQKPNEKQENQINDLVEMMTKWGKEIAEYHLTHTIPHTVETERE